VLDLHARFGLDATVNAWRGTDDSKARPLVDLFIGPGSEGTLVALVNVEVGWVIELVEIISAAVTKVVRKSFQVLCHKVR
jgi:hypothetical protein